MGQPGNWIWVIGGGIFQVPMIREAKQRGFMVVVSDRNPDAPGCRIADQVIVMDTYDVAGHLDIAENVSERPKAVLTVGADVGPTVSALADVFGLPGEKPEVAKRVRNKLQLRKSLNAPHPVYMQLDRSEAYPHTRWKNLCKARGVDPYPCVLKPLQSSGSRGVNLVRNPYGWRDAIRSARQFSKTDYDLIVEEKLSGAEIATDFFLYNGRLYFANAALRIFRSFGIEAGHINPYEIPKEVHFAAKDAAEKLGMTWGPFKVDFIQDPRYGWVIIEAATRLSGGLDHMHTAPLATGKDITGAMLDLALGESVSKSKLKATRDEFACAYSPVLKPGKIAGWNTKNIPPDQVFLLSSDEIGPLENCAARPAFVVGTGRTACSALKSAMRLARSVEVEYA